MTKNQKELLEILGPDYELKTIDNELCIYRKLNPAYDIEISGTARRNAKINIYVWRLHPTSGCPIEIVEKYFNIREHPSIKAVLADITEKYLLAHQTQD